MDILGNSKKEECPKIRLLLRRRRRRTTWKISVQISRWEIDEKLSLKRKDELSNMLDEQTRWVLARVGIRIRRTSEAPDNDEGDNVYDKKDTSVIDFDISNTFIFVLNLISSHLWLYIQISLSLQIFSLFCLLVTLIEKKIPT